jgi:hypothetical protein
MEDAGFTGFGGFSKYSHNNQKRCSPSDSNSGYVAEPEY